MADTGKTMPAGTDSPRINLLGEPESALAMFFDGLGEKPFRARQVMRWIHQRNSFHFDDMTDLSKALRLQLQEVASIRLPEMIAEKTSTDGTIKWLFESAGGQAIESVFIPEPRRGTLCISSQVGCAMDCSFCATGAQGFNGYTGLQRVHKASTVHMAPTGPQGFNGPTGLQRVHATGRAAPPSWRRWQSV